MTYRSALLENLAFRAYNRKIKHPRTVFDWLSRDENVVSLFQSDEKCNFIFTATAFRDLFTLCARANANQTFRRTPRSLPLLFLAGDKDPVGQYGEGVRRVVNLYRSVGVRDIDVVFYVDARHEVLNELGRLEAFGDISRWLEARIADEQQTVESAVTANKHA
jgi:alpha-beta hydrolase superfamily lysophospholipase